MPDFDKRWNVGDVIVSRREGWAPLYRKITKVRPRPAYSWHYCEEDGTIYGLEYLSENSNDVGLVWGWEKFDATPRG